jgi:DNA-binding transcriptional LysR family regulator
MENTWSNLDWNLIRIFVTTAECGSFKKASALLSTSVNTVRRDVERLEDQIGCALFFRQPDGVRLTPEGRRIIASARDVEKSVGDLWRLASSSATTAEGPIRLAITEGLGTFWLIPQLQSYLDQVAGLNRVELQCAMKSVDVLRLEADISVQFDEPKNPDLVRRKLGTLHLTPWASLGYQRRFGLPTSLLELSQHRIVEQETDQLQNYGLDALFGPGAADRMVALKTNFSSAHYWAVSKGIGIGMLPSYAALIGGQVTPVPVPGLKLSPTIWLACHPEVTRSARHRRFIDWLADCFDPGKYPWFRDEFIPPAVLAATFDRNKLRDYFDGFVASSSNIPADPALNMPRPAS